MIQCDPNDFGQMMVSAVRHALGRASYIVSDTTRFAWQHWEDLPAGIRSIIIRDVWEALDRANRDAEYLGHACDHIAWSSFLYRCIGGPGTGPTDSSNTLKALMRQYLSNKE